MSNDDIFFLNLLNFTNFCVLGLFFDAFLKNIYISKINDFKNTSVKIIKDKKISELNNSIRKYK